MNRRIFYYMSVFFVILCFGMKMGGQKEIIADSCVVLSIIFMALYIYQKGLCFKEIVKRTLYLIGVGMLLLLSCIKTNLVWDEILTGIGFILIILFPRPHERK